MEVYRTLPPAAERRPCALTIGNFDGVHLGHQAILHKLQALADDRSTRSGQPLARCVLTFEPHPRDYFAARAGKPSIPRISTERDKLEALAASGVDRVCIAAFNDAMASMQADDFVREIIAEGLMARTLLIGDDFRFGARRAGDFGVLSGLADQHDYELHRTDTIEIGGGRVSSSRVRQALAAGDFAEVELLLGRRYAISGHVVHGRKLGRQWGFPTANLRLPFPQPALAGIFVVRAFGVPADTEGRGWPAVANLGTRPAVARNGRYLLEVHLLGYAGDLYGQLLKVEFLEKLRDETTFDSTTQLAEQIALDTAQARAWFASRQDKHAQG